MQTRLPEALRDTPTGRTADAILRSCVHCGFCNATCPTYLLLGDELDGPRGRIYLIKEALEGAPVTATTQLHLDRCLTCRACETTCPSGVRFGELLEIGRELIEQRPLRSRRSRTTRAALRAWLTGPVFASSFKVATLFRALLPAGLRAKVTPPPSPGTWPVRSHARRMLMPDGCVQRSMAPNINAATARILDRLGIEIVRTAAGGGCCGALRQHLGDGAGALEAARRNIDAWWPAIAAGAEAIVVTASGCGVQVKDYGRLMRSDPVYAERATRVSALAKDPSEVVLGATAALAGMIRAAAPERIVFQAPCTLQHGQKLPGIVERVLADLGVEVLATPERHLCCGSAGAYSIEQPVLSAQLRQRKLASLASVNPDLILSANVGCIAHLAAATATPVCHWIEWLDARLAAEPLSPPPHAG